MGVKILNLRMTVSRDAAISNCKVCNEPENPSFEHDHTLAAKTRASLRYGFIDFFSDIAGHILIGIVLSGVISHFLPDSFFSETAGTGFVSMLMIVVDIPLCVCSDGNRVRTKVCGTPFQNRCGRCFRVRGVWLRVMLG